MSPLNRLGILRGRILNIHHHYEYITMGKTWKDQKKWERKKHQREEDSLKENRREPRRPQDMDDELELDELDNIWDE
jgi:hypothetical protein